MLKPLQFALGGFALAACTPASAPTAPDNLWQETLAQHGLAAAEAKLAELPESAEHSFLLGGLQFLRASEAIMQVRYQNSSTSLALLPGMRNSLPANPDAEFDPAFIEIAMTQALDHLARAEASLERATGRDMAVEFPLDAIWFDINANGTRDEWESGLAVMADLNASPDADFDGLIRFDTADAHWLKAYVHVMSGMAEMTLATDPTPAIRTVYDSRREMDALGPVEGMFLDNETIDTIAAVLLTLRGTPDQARTRVAHAHFKAMIAENKAFWTAVMNETDNDREWLPNPQQSSAFGVEVDAEMAAGWQAVLAEIEDVLNGDALVPYWRIQNGFEAETGVGVNVAKFLQDPGDMDIILWLHGAGAAPYLERGKLAQLEAWDRFARMTGGDGLMFAAWFN
ncbi:MAG: hypothetical protein HRT80_05060 [Henriciella sp.]|nr:hypothetical protein [Henriciella sp.]